MRISGRNDTKDKTAGFAASGFVLIENVIYASDMLLIRP